MPTTAERVELAAGGQLRHLAKLPPMERIVEGGETISALLELEGRVAAVRRAAVRELRGQGWRLQDIADELGVSRQRVAQIERGR